jgi:mersacidin/lichenicidin family type 2 lantibiotic
MDHINISDIDVVRAWKDEEYRSSLTEAQRAQLPENPAGMIELTDEALNEVVGGFTSFLTQRLRCGQHLSITAECACPGSLTGRCRCLFSAAEVSAEVSVTALGESLTALELEP